DMRDDRWVLRDVTAEISGAAGLARESARITAVKTETAAIQTVVRAIAQRAGLPPLTKGEAEALLRSHGLKQKAARAVLVREDGAPWGVPPSRGAGPGPPPGVALRAVTPPPSSPSPRPLSSERPDRTTEERRGRPPHPTWTESPSPSSPRQYGLDEGDALS